jgi:hypothetical protein
LLLPRQNNRESREGFLSCGMTRGTEARSSVVALAWPGGTGGALRWPARTGGEGCVDAGPANGPGRS